MTEEQEVKKPFLDWLQEKLGYKTKWRMYLNLGMDAVCLAIFLWVAWEIPNVTCVAPSIPLQEYNNLALVHTNSTPNEILAIYFLNHSYNTTSPNWITNFTIGSNEIIQGKKII